MIIFVIGHPVEVDQLAHEGFVADCQFCFLLDFGVGSQSEVSFEEFVNYVVVNFLCILHLLAGFDSNSGQGYDKLEHGQTRIPIVLHTGILQILAVGIH